VTQVIVLNGGSSSGKSSIARCLQAALPDPWLAFSVDDLVDAMPAAMRSSDTGIEFAVDGSVSVGESFAALETAWRAGLAAMARAGARVIVDDVFLSGAGSQRRWQKPLEGLSVLWVGVRCAVEVAQRRELARGDRPAGMAASQAKIVHKDVIYDLEVDSTYTSAVDCARVIAGSVGVS
jgi:chloramphenicol 3-O phosphotransferase